MCFMALLVLASQSHGARKSLSEWVARFWTRNESKAVNEEPSRNRLFMGPLTGKPQARAKR